MIKDLLHIDVSKYETEEDLIEIQLQNGDIFQVSFSKFFNQSKYLQDKYKYAKAFSSIQVEIEKIKKEFNISDESIKLFIELVQEEKIDIPQNYYKVFYTLSEYFGIQKVTKELDNIRQKELCNDLDFTIQLIIDFETAQNKIESKIIIKIENFLRERINECISNSKFGHLPISTIGRILSKCQKSVNNDLLFDFIFKSVEIRFILIKFIELDKLKEAKIDQLIKFIEKDPKKMYLDYIPFNLPFIKNLKNKYNQVNDELNSLQQKNEELLNEIQECKNARNKQNQQIKELLEQNAQLQKQIKEYQVENKKEVLIKKPEHSKINQEQTEAKENVDHLCKYDIFVAGYNKFNQLGEKPNNKSKIISNPIISPPIKLSSDFSSLQSYSIFCRHSVLITHDGSLKGIGYNEDGRITSSLQKANFDHFTEFSIKDGSGHQLNPISAVCYFYGTLYMFSKVNGSGRLLVICDKDIKEGSPVFLEIGNHDPIALFGGRYHSAAICSEGEVIFINRHSVMKSPDSCIAAVSLPDGEKASSVACCNDSVIVLTSSGRVYESPVEKGSSKLKFSEVVELSGNEIICVSGTYEHFLAVSEEGKVFGRGSNNYGKLGFGEETESSSLFVEIPLLGGYKIMAAFAGCEHSLFQTQEGKILSCGDNDNGDLLLNDGPSGNVHSPVETMITGGAAFCITGWELSVVFIGKSPPPNMPNTRIWHNK